MNYSDKTLILKYTIDYTAFQPNSLNVGTIIFDTIPKDSYANSAYIGSNINFSGGSITKAVVRSNLPLFIGNITDEKDCLRHPYGALSVPVPVSDDILISSKNGEEIKIQLTVTGGIINDLTSGKFDIYFTVNEILYPNKLDLVFKTPWAAWGMEKYHNAYANDWGRIYRVSDGASKWFGFLNNHVDNASIIAWLAGSVGLLHNILDQSGSGHHLQQGNPNNMPVYDPVNSKAVFDGINDYLLLSTPYDDFNVTLFSLNTVDDYYLLAHTAITTSWYGTYDTTTVFRFDGRNLIFNISKSGKTFGVITENKDFVRCRADGIEADNSPQISASAKYKFNNIGTKKHQGYYEGDFYSLFVYDSVLADTEIHLLEQFYKNP